MEARPELLKKILPIVIIIVVLGIIAALFLFQPKAQKRKANNGPVINVELMDIVQTDIVPQILSYGLVEPRTRTTLVSQVGGRIVSISEQFRDGGFFNEGDSLMQIDPTDHQVDVDIALADVAQAEQALAEEHAQADQAKSDWKRLGASESISPLVLRKPQLKAAQANVNSAKARLKQAQTNLERTSVKAPYSGRVLSTNVDLGQVVTNNTELGEVYATDMIEVRLPVKNEDLPLLNLPEYYRGQEQVSQDLPLVNIHSELAKDETWQAQLVRTAGSIDETSRQLYVVARIDDPFGEKAQGRFQLKIGQYVKAEINGANLNSAISIPNKAIYQGSYVYLFKDGAVYRTPIEIRWQNQDTAVISKGITAGDQLVVSPLGQVTSGTLVKVSSNSATDSATATDVSDNTTPASPANNSKAGPDAAKRESKASKLENVGGSK